MANIKNELNNIKSALYGKDVRSSVHDGIDAINKEVENTTNRQVGLENTFDQLVINAGNSNAEIVDARVKNDGTSYSKLGDRLNEVDSQLAHIKKHDLSVNVKDFGAKLDGVTDDTDAILEAINSMENGGELFFPKGVYMVRPGEVKINKSNFTIRGVYGLTIIKNIPKDYTGLGELERFNTIEFANNVNNVLISGITIDGNSSRQTNRPRKYDSVTRCNLLHFKGDNSNIIIDKCNFIDTIGEGVSIGENTNVSKNISIINSSFSNCQDHFIDILNSDGVIIENNGFYNAGLEIEGYNALQGNGIVLQRHADYFGDKTIGKNAIIKNNKIDKTTRKAIYCQYNDSKIESNTINNSQWASISINTGVENVMVCNNTITNSSDCAILVAGYHSNKDNVKFNNNIVIKNNYIKNTGLKSEAAQKMGVGVWTSNNVKIEDNTIIDYKQYGVHISSITVGGTNFLCANTIVRGNKITQTKEPTTSTIGILMNSYKHNIIDSNFIENTYDFAIRVTNIIDDDMYKIQNNIINNVYGATSFAIHLDKCKSCNVIGNAISGAIVGINLNASALHTDCSFNIINNTFSNLTLRSLNVSGDKYDIFKELNFFNNTQSNVVEDIMPVKGRFIPVFKNDAVNNCKVYTTNVNGTLSGYFKNGDKFITLPVVDKIGYVCIEEGNPGKWKAYGVL